MGTGDHARGRDRAGARAERGGDPRRHRGEARGEEAGRAGAEPGSSSTGGAGAGELAGGSERGRGAARHAAAAQAGVARQAQIRIRVGAAGSGKSTAIKIELERERAGSCWRLIVDPDGEYVRHGLRCRDLDELVTRSAGPACSLVFVPSHDRAVAVKEFSVICGRAWRLAEWGRAVHLVVDELSEFTSATEAPHEWRRLVKRGRKAGITIDAAAQRPAEIDKTIWSQATLVRTGWLGYAADQAVVAAALGVDVDQVRALAPLEYLELDRNAGGRVARGRLTF